MPHSHRRWSFATLACIALLAVSGAASANSYVWVDQDGVTHMTDDSKAVPPSAAPAREQGVDSIRSLWTDGLTGPALMTPEGASGTDEDRVARLLRAAVHDLQRGETSRANATLRSVLRLDPSSPEAHWHLALLERQRGRFGSVESHLRAFLSSAGDGYEGWRKSAERMLASLADELRLADESRELGELRLVTEEGPHFRIQFDEELGAVRPDYAATVMRYLEGARDDVSLQVGVTPLEPLGVVFYGRAAYVRAHRHRFSFQTVGFFDGRIHVSSPAHPSGALRSLLFHEYTHAVFRDQTGGDRPYWLNEGLAERIERSSRKQRPTTRSERAHLRERIESGSWISLRRLAPGFSGLGDDDARAAYLEAVAAVEWIESRTTPPQRARMLARLGEGMSMDQALYEALGMNTEGLDAALRREILADFPADAP